MNKKDNSFEVDYRYDYDYDVLAIKVKRFFNYSRTIEIDEGILLDFDDKNIPVSLEILDASKILNLPKSCLNDLLCFNIKVSVDNKSIGINGTFMAIIQNKQENSILDYFTSNYLHIPSIDAELFA